MSEDYPERVVNGVTLHPVYAWRTGDYFISTDSMRAAESGVGHFTVARMDYSVYPAFLMHYVEKAWSLADAVTVAACDAEARGVAL